MARPQGHPRTGHYWPMPADVQLLRAALLDGETALAAWRQWQTIADIDRLDIGSERLVPLLAYNLKRCGLEHPPLGRYDGLFHYTWVTNQRRLAHTARAVRIFQQAGIPAMLLKGMALAAHVYRHLGLRPMDDVDLLVPHAEAPRAMELLRAHGWRPVGPDSDLATRHARLFVADDRRAHIDLHWHALWELTGQGTDDELWARADTAHAGDVPVRVLGPADLVLQVVVHGARWNDVPSVRWAADAMTILVTAGAAFDWPLLVAQAQRHAFMLPVGLALEWLVEALDAPVPPAVLATFAAHQPSTFERAEQRAREWTSPWVGSLPLVICHHVRVTRARGPLAIAAGLPRYLQGAYGLPALRHLPAALYTRVINRVRGSATRRVRN